MKKKLVIFDLDGTLLNSLSSLTDATNVALKKEGFALHTETEMLSFVGHGVRELLWRALPNDKKTPENLEKVKKHFYAYYDEHLWGTTYPYEGITQVLEDLQARGVLLAVASNKYQRAVERLMPHFFPQISFASVKGQQKDGPVKPNPQIVHRILEHTKMAARDALYVGDSDVDMQTARNAGVQACGVTWGFKPREVLASYQPDYLIDTPEKLPELV